MNENENKELNEEDIVKEKTDVGTNEVKEAPVHRDVDQELIELIRNTDLTEEEKQELLEDYHENDIASILEELTREERVALYRLLGDELVSEVFAYLDDPAEYLEELSVETAADIIEQMDADDAVDVLEDLDEDVQQAIIEQMDEEAQEDVRLIQSYEEEEIGSKMTTNYIAIHRGLSVKQAMRAVVEQTAENDNMSTIYILNQDETFYGTLTLQELIIAREGTDLEPLVVTSYPYVYDRETVAECIERLKDYSEDSIPVVDQGMKLLGVITSQDLVEVVDEEMGDDYAKLAGLTSEEDMDETLVQSIAKRIPWLMILMVLGLGVSSIVGMFEAVVAQLTIVVAFQSLILGMAGNVGTQSLAVTIRVLTDEKLDARQKLKLMFKELKVGVCNGLMLGLISCVFVGLYIHFIKHETFLFAFQVSGCLGLAMLLAMTISSLTGTVIPMFFKRIHIDPAVASGPLITTVNDMVAVFSYYGLALLLLIPNIPVA